MADKPQPVLFADKPEWNDVTPIPQNEPGMSPIAPIYYSAAYKDATDYFRGIVKLGEMSERALQLTEAVIRLNPANYSAWQYRYQTLLKLDKSIDEELALMDEIATRHLKTYQVWHHRRLLLTRLRATHKPNSDAPANGDAETKAKTPLSYARRELTFIAGGLRQDAKNYHTWSYRQWVLTQFAGSEGGEGDESGEPSEGEGMWAAELDFVDNLLEEDVRNNSAWHHRFFVVFSRGGPALEGTEEDKEELLKRELGYAKDKIALAPNNASAWNYLRGVLDFTHTPYSILSTFVKPYTIQRPPPQSFEGSESTSPTSKATPAGDEEQVIDLDNPAPSVGAELPAVPALEFQADIHERKGTDEGTKNAVQIWRVLADKHDSIRKQYWEYRMRGAQATKT